MAAAAFEGSLSPNPLMATAQFSSSFPVTAVGAGAGASAAANAAGATATAVITAGSAAADKYKGSQAQGQWQAQGQAQWQGQEQGAGQGQSRVQAQLQVQLGPGGAYGASQMPQYSSNGISQYDNPLAGQQYGSTGGGAAAEGAGAPAAAGEARGGQGRRGQVPGGAARSAAGAGGGQWQRQLLTAAAAGVSKAGRCRQGGPCGPCLSGLGQARAPSQWCWRRLPRKCEGEGRCRGWRRGWRQARQGRWRKGNRRLKGRWGEGVAAGGQQGQPVAAGPLGGPCPPGPVPVSAGKGRGWCFVCFDVNGGEVGMCNVECREGLDAPACIWTCTSRQAEVAGAGHGVCTQALWCRVQNESRSCWEP